MLLRVEHLQVAFPTGTGDPFPAVDGISFALDRGRTLALVGESGCGKSLTALSILRLTPPAARLAGSIVFDGQDLLRLPEPALRRVRGRRIAMIFQEPMSSLNPVLTIGDQIAEVLRRHEHASARQARQRAIDLLRKVGIASPEQRFRAYPHEFSGGMRQRVMIAMALACRPDLLIADEPTTALDVTVQAQILGLLRKLREQLGMAMLFISHDLGVVARVADEIAVMYAGRIVERAPTADLLRRPHHPYTQALLECVPRLRAPRQGDPPAGVPHHRDPSARVQVATEMQPPATTKPAARQPLPTVPGDVPITGRPPGCAFHPRCRLCAADPRCLTQAPALLPVADRHECACWKAPGSWLR